ncbi:MAG: basic amino acid ABC transporter substrate-binding protein [Desulfitobacteriia bacterium]|jgi:glutamine transport system substrate-binding protein
MKKGWQKALVFMLIISLLALAGCAGNKPADQQGADEPKVLKVGSDIAYAPFEFYDENHVAKGFDIDLLTAIAEDMGYEIEFETAAFDGLIPALQANKYDCIISAMTIREDRAKSILFSDPYFKAEQYIAFLEGKNYSKVADLKDAKIGVQLNTTGQFVLEDVGLKPQKYDIMPDALNALLHGGVDAVVGDNQAILEFIKANPGTNIKYVTADTGDEFYGIGFNLENTELAEKVNASLKKIKDSGKYAEIYGKWFEGEVPVF